MAVYGGGHGKCEKQMHEVQEYCSRALRGRLKSLAHGVTVTGVQRLSLGHHGNEGGSD